MNAPDLPITLATRAERRAAVRNAEAETTIRHLWKSKPGSIDRSASLGKARRLLAQHEAGTGVLTGNDLVAGLRNAIEAADKDSKRHDALMDRIGEVTGRHPYDEE